MEQTLRTALLAALTSLVVASGYCRAQLRIVSWNTAGGPREGIGDILAAIGNESVNGVSRPIDVLSLQEQSSFITTTQAIVDELNAIYGAGTYVQGLVDGDTSGAGRPGLIYNIQTVALLDTVAFGTVDTSAQARQTLRYELGAGNTSFYLYSNHYKASTGSTNENRRLVEATAVRADADALGDGTNIIYTGDFNIRSSTEASYQELLSAGNGQAFDPVNAPGTWHDNASFRQWHTQAPSTNPPGSLVGGGVDDRFDFQLLSGELLDGEGLDYIPGSYRVFGNNGTHDLNGSISTGTGASASILATLEAVSDHLPVVVDYQIPAKYEYKLVDGEFIPERVVLGSTIEVVARVDNFADVSVPIGADELDYSITGVDGFLGSHSGTVEALSSGNLHSFMLDTTTIGMKRPNFDFVSFSPESTQTPVFYVYLPFEVVDPTGDFDGDDEQDGTDFLTWQRNVGTGSYLFEGDADGNRTVDGDDLALWQSQYDITPPFWWLPSTVPEPSALALLILAVVATLASNRSI